MQILMFILAMVGFVGFGVALGLLISSKTARERMKMPSAVVMGICLFIGIFALASLQNVPSSNTSAEFYTAEDTHQAKLHEGVEGTRDILNDVEEEPTEANTGKFDKVLRIFEGADGKFYWQYGTYLNDWLEEDTYDKALAAGESYAKYSDKLQREKKAKENGTFFKEVTE